MRETAAILLFSVPRRKKARQVSGSEVINFEAEAKKIRKWREYEEYSKKYFEKFIHARHTYTGMMDDFQKRDKFERQSSVESLGELLARGSVLVKVAAEVDPNFLHLLQRVQFVSKDLLGLIRALPKCNTGLDEHKDMIAGFEMRNQTLNMLLDPYILQRKALKPAYL